MKTETLLILGVGVVVVVLVMRAQQPQQPQGPNWAGIGQGASSIITAIGGLFKSSGGTPDSSSTGDGTQSIFQTGFA